MMPTAYRLPDQPWPGGRGVYDWTVGGYRQVIACASAGLELDRRAHAEILPHRTGSSAERCALHGGSHYWGDKGA